MSENSSIGILCRTMDERRKAVFPILHIWRMQKRKHRMEENGTKVPRTGQREPTSNVGLMNEEKRNASLTTRALNKGIRIESGGTDIHYMKS